MLFWNIIFSRVFNRYDCITAYHFDSDQWWNLSLFCFLACSDRVNIVTINIKLGGQIGSLRHFNRFILNVTVLHKRRILMDIFDIQFILNTTVTIGTSYICWNTRSGLAFQEYSNNFISRMQKKTISHV